MNSPAHSRADWIAAYALAGAISDHNEDDCVQTMVDAARETPQVLDWAMGRLEDLTVGDCSSHHRALQLLRTAQRRLPPE